MDNIHPECHHIAKPRPVVFSGKPDRDKFLVGSDHMMGQCGAAIGGDQEEAGLIGEDVRFVRAEHLYRDVAPAPSVCWPKFLRRSPTAQDGKVMLFRKRKAVFLIGQTDVFFNGRSFMRRCQRGTIGIQARIADAQWKALHAPEDPRSVMQLFE